MSLELIGVIAAVVSAVVAVMSVTRTPIWAARRWWREHYRRPSWADAWAKTRLHRRRQKAALREAEDVAPGLLTELQRSLEEYPDRRRFRVLQGGVFTISDSSSAPTIDYSHDGDGDLGGWVARHADGLFRRVPSMSSPPVYEMSEELARYLNGRRH